MEMEYEIREITEPTPALREALARLLPQLSAQARETTPERLGVLLASPSACLLGVWTERRIDGMLTLAWYDTPSGRRAWIEDVVVDASLRGCGAGEALVRAALERADALGAGQVMLTSAPHREAARALYRKLGFEEAPTSVFVRRKPEK